MVYSKIIKIIMLILFIILVSLIFCFAKKVYIDDEILPVKKEKVLFFKAVQSGTISIQYTKLGVGNGLALK